MNARQHLCTALLALAPLCSLTLAAAPAQAQDYARDAAYNPAISGFNVDEVRHLAPGVELNFDLYGTPGGRAVLHIDGATRNLHMTETEPGQYEGSYTIGVHDRITAASGVTANLRTGNRVTTAALGEPLLRGAGMHEARRAGDLAAVPRVERFDVQADDLAPGNDLAFKVRGTPGAKVEVTVAGSRGVFFLPEVSPGEYSGVYRIRGRDRIAADSAVTATIRANGRYSTAALGRPLLAADARVAQRARYCSNCATVEAVNVVEVSGDGSYLGTVGGALVGGLLGSQVGSGSGRTAAEVAGAVGGAAVGHNIEQNGRHRQRYEVVVRYANGATQTIPYENNPGFQAGERVKVNNGVISRDY
jgi:outer membrane lipoprotein SlyB